MDTDAIDLIRTKLSGLFMYLAELEEELPATAEEYLSGGRLLHGFVERRCQVAAEGMPVPATSREAIEALHQLGVTDEETTRRFAGTFVGFRNRLVHDYDQVDQRIVYHTARRLIDYGRRYAAALAAYVDSQPTP